MRQSLDERRHPRHGHVDEDVNNDNDDDESIHTIDRPPLAAAAITPKRVYGPHSPAVLALLVPSSLLGVLARLGIEALATYPGAAIFPLAYVQAIGCLVMGICQPLRDDMAVFYPPLYTALTTGFCGTLTTFSSWQHDVFVSWLNSEQYDRHGLQNFIDGAGKTCFTLAISTASLSLGRRIGHRLHRRITFRPFPSLAVRWSLYIVSCLSLVATIPAYLFLSPSFRHKATAALLFAYPGVLIRYLLSVRFNSIKFLFPIGTFLANATGTALFGAFFALQGRPVNSQACGLLQGLLDGFCGGLTTVSTFAVELSGLATRHAIFYVSVSWGVSQLLLLAILGPAYWAGDVTESILCVYEK